MLDSIFSWFADKFESMMEWFYDLVQWIPKKIWASLLDALASLLESIPVPDFMHQINGFFLSIPPGVIWLLQYAAVAEGVGFITAAMVIRFVIRRIPIIG